MPRSYARLRGRITEKYGSIDAFASAMNKYGQNVSKKICNGKFTKRDIEQWSEMLDIPAKDIGLYFFIP